MNANTKKIYKGIESFSGQRIKATDFVTFACPIDRDGKTIVTVSRNIMSYHLIKVT